MTNLIEALELARTFQENDAMMQRTKQFFTVSPQHGKVFADHIDIIRKLEDFLLTLGNEDARISLTDDDYSVDYYFLVDQLQNGSIRNFYMDIKLIRAEMLALTTPDGLEEFKKLNEFWEKLELSVYVLIK